MAGMAMVVLLSALLMLPAFVASQTAPGLRGQSHFSWSSSQSSSSSWQRGADGKVHQQLKEMREEGSSNGAHRSARKAAIACVDGHCKGVAAKTPDSDQLGGLPAISSFEGSFTQPSPLNTDALMGDMSGLPATDSFGGFLDRRRPLGIGSMTGMKGGLFGHMERQMHHDMARMDRDMDRDMARMHRDMAQMDRDVVEDVDLAEERGHRSLIGDVGQSFSVSRSGSAGPRSASRSFSISQDGSRSVVQSTDCKDGACRQTIQKYRRDGATPVGESRAAPEAPRGADGTAAPTGPTPVEKDVAEQPVVDAAPATRDITET